MFKHLNPYCIGKGKKILSTGFLTNKTKKKIDTIAAYNGYGQENSFVIVTYSLIYSHTHILEILSNLKMSIYEKG